MELWAVVSTLETEDGPFVRLFTSEEAAKRWAWDFLAERWGEREMQNYDFNSEDWTEDVADNLGILDWFFIEKCQHSDQVDEAIGQLAG